MQESIKTWCAGISLCPAHFFTTLVDVENSCFHSTFRPSWHYCLMALPCHLPPHSPRFFFAQIWHSRTSYQGGFCDREPSLSFRGECAAIGFAHSATFRDATRLCYSWFRTGCVAELTGSLKTGDSCSQTRKESGCSPGTWYVLSYDSAPKLRDQHSGWVAPF